MPDVFTPAGPDEDDDATPGLRVAGALTGYGEEPPEEEAPQPQQPQGVVDSSGQSYMASVAPEGDGTPNPSANAAPASSTSVYTTPAAKPALVAPTPAALKPFDDHSGDQAAMAALKAKEATENTKPSIGRKILAGLSAGAAGFGSRNAEVGARIGQDILNGPRADAEARWATQEAPIQARLTADQAADAATQSANAITDKQNRTDASNYRNQVLGQQDQARAENQHAQAAARNEQVNGDGWKRDEPNNPLGSYTATTIGGKTIHSATAPASVQNTADYKIADADAKGHPFTPEQQQILRGGGKLTYRPPANPRQPSEGEISLGQARAAFIKENGRPPQTLAEQNQVTQAAKGNLDKTSVGSMGSDEIIAKSIQDKNTFMSQWERIGKEDASELTPEGSYQNLDNPKKVMSAAEYNAKVDKFRTDANANPRMIKSGTMMDTQGNTITNRFSRNPQTAAAPAASPNATTAAAPTQAQPAGTSQQPLVRHFQGRPYAQDSKTGQWILQSVGDPNGNLKVPANLAAARDAYSKWKANAKPGETPPTGMQVPDAKMR